MEMNREIVALENKLAVEKAATDAERRKNHTMSKQRQNINDGDGDGDGGDDDDGDDNERFSPTTTAKHYSTNRINIWPVTVSTVTNRLILMEHSPKDYGY